MQLILRQAHRTHPRHLVCAQVGLYSVLFNSLDCPPTHLPPLTPSQAHDTAAANLRKGHGPSRARRLFKRPVLGKVGGSGIEGRRRVCVCVRACVRVCMHANACWVCLHAGDRDRPWGLGLPGGLKWHLGSWAA